MSAEPSPDSLVAAIHAQPVRLAIVATGGGSQAIADLLAVPGGSRTILEAVVPYAEGALDEYLRGRPEHFCCERTARLMAMAAYQRACQLSADSTATIVGIGATASLVSDRPKRGPHRLHVAAQTIRSTHSVSARTISSIWPSTIR